MRLRASILALLFTSTLSAFAAAPLATTGNPGYYRFKLGTFEVNVLSDGTFEMPMPKMLSNISPAEVKKSLAKNFLGDLFETSDNAYLINTGTKLVLIDTGCGKSFGPAMGKVIEHMKAAGYQPEQVDAVLITHMHGDHVGGLMNDGKIVFPNAKLYIDKLDTDYWLNPENMNKGPADMKDHFQGAMNSVNPYVKTSQFKPITADGEIVPGIRSHASHGHTPGHSSYEIESGGQKLVLLGDLLHVASVQFEHPSARMKFDSDLGAAEKQRRAAFADAAKNGTMIGSAHIAFPGVGHVRAEKSGYVFVPVNYTR